MTRTVEIHAMRTLAIFALSSIYCINKRNTAVDELAAQLGVSAVSVRRDLEIPSPTRSGTAIRNL
jgi:predicted DNA-binding transcriptional regulator YafY